MPTVLAFFFETKSLITTHATYSYMNIKTCILQNRRRRRRSSSVDLGRSAQTHQSCRTSARRNSSLARRSCPDPTLISSFQRYAVSKTGHSRTRSPCTGNYLFFSEPMRSARNLHSVPRLALSYYTTQPCVFVTFTLQHAQHIT